MPINVLELHHHGIRIGTSPDDVKEAKSFYTDLLGLDADPARPEIPGIPGFWVYVGQGDHTAQIHLMGATGQSPAARDHERDPTLPHVALAVEDINAARATLEAEGIWHWTVNGLVGENSDQVFMKDPFGNIIELHQVGTCTCNRIVLKQQSTN